MENLRNEVIKSLKIKLGEEYEIYPKDKRKNNGLALHGVCIHKKGDSISPVVYLEEFIQHNVIGELNPENLADIFLKKCHQEEIPQTVVAGLKDFGMVKERVRIKLVNHAANLRELVNSPHRKFLDLAIAYYLDLDIAISGQHASVAITNELMEIWGVSEDELYRLGMAKLLEKGACCITGMLDVLKEIAQEEQSMISEEAVAEFEKDQNGPDLYVAANQKRHLGANCLLNVSLLQELADRKGCNLIIFPSSIHELVILPQKDGNENCMGTEDVQAINTAQVAREDWLSNSIYRYDREKKEVSLYKEGEPLIW